MKKLLLIVTSVALLGCAQEARHAPQDLPQGQNKALALQSLSTGHHKRADIALQSQDRETARQEMRALLATLQKHETQTALDFDLRFDAATRLAQLHLEDKQLQEAENVARQALQHEDQAPNTLFRGYLHQTLADILEKKGDPRGAVDEHGQAIEIFKAILDRSPGHPSPGSHIP